MILRLLLPYDRIGMKKQTFKGDSDMGNVQKKTT